MKDRHFTITDSMIYHNPNALDWSICQNTRQLVQMSEDFGAERIAASAMIAFIGHACETEEGDILMYSVDANDREDTCIFVSNHCPNPILRDRKVVPNHRYVIFRNAGDLYELHYVTGTKVSHVIPGITFEMMYPDPQMV